MAAKSNITKKKAPSHLNGLKAVTNWIFGRQRRKEELEYLIRTYDIDNNVFKRFLLFIYNSPHLAWYINKYMNHLYHFNRFDTIDLLYSLTYMLDINRITRKSIPEKLFYLKNTELADKNKTKIKDLFGEYFGKVYDKEYNDLELNFFYDLVTVNHISFEQIESIDKHINSGKSTITLEETVALPNSPKINNFVLDVYRELAPSMKDACNGTKEFILSRPECKGCELFGKPTVVLDTNMEEFGEVDVIFFGLNPKTEDTEIGKPFSSKDGKVLRERMSLFPTHIKWVITNVILCHTKNESEIKNLEDVKKRCHDLVDGIRQAFPAKIIVPLGAKAADWFGLKGGMVNLSGKVFTNQNQTFVPVIHPSSANYNADNLTTFKKDFGTILNLLKPTESQAPVQTTMPSAPSVEKKKSTPRYDEPLPTSGGKFISQVTPDLTFFDVREVNDQILTIYIDQKGQKKYKVDDYKLHFYLKNAGWRNCDQIAENMDGIVEITGREKHQAIKLIRDRLNTLKNGR